MLWLDCTDPDSTLSSLARAAGTDRDKLARTLSEYDDARLADSWDPPEERLARDVLTQLGTRPEAVLECLSGAHYFHGTRALDPDSFRRRGLLPLDAVLEELWTMLRLIAGYERTDDEWARFRASVEAEGGGHDGSLYRLKTGDRGHFGPHGELVREVFLNPDLTSSHDYLGCPEIVQDIARCYADTYGGDLEGRFCATAKPCLVKFRAPVWAGAVTSAVSYAYLKVRGEELGRSVCGGFVGEGVPVPPECIVDVEVVVRAP